MRAAFVAQVIQHHRRVGQRLLAALLLAVQRAHGVDFHTLLAGAAQTVLSGREVFAEGLLVRGTAVGAADGVDAHGQVFQPEIGQKPDHQPDQLRVRGGLNRAEALHAELVMLAQPPGLRRLIAEMRRVDIVHFQGKRLRVQAAFQKGAHGPGGAFGLEGHATVALVQKGVHLLADHVAALARRTCEKLRMLQYGRADFPVSGRQGRPAHLPLQGAPSRAFGGKHVLHSLEYLQHVLHLVKSSVEKATDD